MVAYTPRYSTALVGHFVMTTRWMFPCFCEFVERPELPHDGGDSISLQSPASTKEMEFDCDG